MNKIESIGLLACEKCGKNYFLLDSGDYWYDSIQEKYPPKIKCSKCKNELFQVTLTYEFRQDSNDVRYIKIVGNCAKCNAPKQLGTWEIKYGGTDSLIKYPIVVCKNPKIKYDLLTKTCYWTLEDMRKFIEFLYELKLSIYCEYFENKKVLTKKISKEEAIKRVLNDHGYYDFLASKKELIIPKNQEINWKKEEVLSIPSPTKMCLHSGINKISLLFSIEYTSNYIEDLESGKVKEKSAEFKEIIRKVDDWLKLNYKNLRGKNSFDNPEVLKGLVADKSVKKETTIRGLIRQLFFKIVNK